VPCPSSHRIHETVGVSVALIAANLSFAADPARPAAWEFSVGGGALVAPAFPGSSDYQIMVVPDVRVTYGETFYASVDQGIGYRFDLGSGWTAGPLVTFDFGRDAEGSPFSFGSDEVEALRGFTDIDSTLQAGAFVNFEQGPWTTHLEFQQALGGHEGFTADLSVRFKHAFGDPRTSGRPPLLLSTGPRLRWADDARQNAYFGVSTADALTTGLPAYQASGGVASIGWNLTIAQPLSRNWFMFALVSYDRLLGDAVDSPLVRQRGSPNQFVGGAFASYRF
jgi:MipA family protein